MNIVIIIYLLFHLSSVASAEIYTWEDANGTNFSDAPSSLPDTYRDEAFEGTNPQIVAVIPHKRVVIPEQKKPDTARKYQTTANRTDSDRHAGTAPVSDRIDTETFPSLAGLIVTWIVIALFLSITWIVTIADIVRSDYLTASTKRGWLLVVVCIPVLGMLFYHILGLRQKNQDRCCNEKQPA